jgi:hypothetical protein
MIDKPWRSTIDVTNGRAALVQNGRECHHLTPAQRSCAFEQGTAVMTSRSRAWWVAGGALICGGVLWATLRIGVPAFLTDEHHRARPVLEASSWIAGIAGLLVASVALAVAIRQGRVHRASEPAPGSPTSQTATAGGVVFTGDVTGGSGSGSTTGVHIGQVGNSSDPQTPTRP